MVQHPANWDMLVLRAIFRYSESQEADRAIGARHPKPPRLSLKLSHLPASLASLASLASFRLWASWMACNAKMGR